MIGYDFMTASTEEKIIAVLILLFVGIIIFIVDKYPKKINQDLP